MTRPAARGPVLRQNIVNLANAFAKARGIKEATVSRLIRGDMHFLKDYGRGRISVTVKKYDDIVNYFFDNWPDDTPMPPLRGY